MKLTFGTNIASLKAQRQLAKGQDTLSTVFERLSSGQRINRASDDAAGLAIADSLRADARVHTAAIRNINDGLSLLNIMDSALEAQAGILTRLQELAEQAANGVYSSEQREALQTEFDTLREEFSRIAETTEFNGEKLLLSERSGNRDALFIQAGIDASSNSLINTQLTDTGTFSGTINLQDLLDSATGQGTILSNLGGTLQATEEEILTQYGDLVIRTTGIDGDGDVRNVILVAYSQSTNGDGIYFLDFVESESTPGVYENQINVSDFSLSTVGSIRYDSSGEIVHDGLSGLIVNDGATLGEFDFSALTITGTSESFGAVGSGETSALELLTLSTEESARTALDAVSARSSEMNSLRAEIGAGMSRLEFALRVAENTRDSYLAAESRIRDADVAEEVAKLTQAQILQQTGAAVLAQANQQPQITLQLLQGVKRR